jgi:hypothetical protein
MRYPPGLGPSGLSPLHAVADATMFVTGQSRRSAPARTPPRPPPFQIGSHRVPGWKAPTTADMSPVLGGKIGTFFRLFGRFLPPTTAHMHPTGS